MCLELSFIFFVFILLADVLRIYQYSVEAERKAKLPSRHIEGEFAAERAIRAILQDW